MERKGPEAGRPAAVPDGAAPAPTAPRIGSAASILRLQRTAGNRAVQALLRANASPTIRRAWRPDGTWDAVISGIRWQRREQDGVTQYSFVVVDSTALPKAAVSMYADTWEPAAWWKDDWLYGDDLWRDDLTSAAGAPAKSADGPAAPTKAADGPTAGGAGAATAAATATAVEVEEPDEVEEGLRAPPPSPVLGARAAPSKAAESAKQAAAPAKAAPAKAAAVAGVRQVDPIVRSAGAGRVAKDGGYKWVSSLAIATALTVDSWIIQHVTMTGCDEDDAFYEAFRVPAGQTAAEGDDVFEERVLNAGTRTVTGRFQHIVYGAGQAPPGMEVGGGGHADRSQRTSADAPSGWANGQGAAHDLTYRWGGGADPTLVTVPPSGPPAVIDHFWDL